MKAILFAATTALVLSGCAAMRAEDHAAHHPPPSAAGSGADRAAEQMKEMQEMHRKMRAAKTPEERQALMADHMKAMKDGMSMMCQMGGEGQEAREGAGSKDMMKRCMDMKDMTMKMMREREAGLSTVR